MDISFVIVNYKSQACLTKCLESINGKTGDLLSEIIVVNNDKEKLFGVENIKVVENEKNCGFGTACNLGAKKASGRILFFLNPDTEIITLDFVQVISQMENNGFSIVAPQLIDPSGRPEKWSVGKIITPLGIIKNNFTFFGIKKYWLKSAAGEVDWVSGAAFAVRKDLFEKIGGFDENFFMYFEDVDLGKRIKDAGGKILYAPQYKVLHLGGQSYGDGKKQKAAYYKSQDYYLEKHFGKFSSVLVRLLRKIFRKI